MKKFLMTGGLFLSLIFSLEATDPPRLKVSRTVPMASAEVQSVKAVTGRFVPLELPDAVPALVETSDATFVRVFEVKPGGTLIGVRYDEADGSDAKEYTFPDAKGSVYCAVVKSKAGVVTIKATINSTDPKLPPVVAGMVTIETNGGVPPIVPPVIPPIIPPVKPDPQPVVDPLFSSLTFAYQLEDADRSLLPGLISVYDAAAKTTVVYSTWGQLFNAMAKDASDAKVSGKLNFVQTVIQKELKATLPWQGSMAAPLDAAGAATAKAEFTKIVGYLNKLK